MSSGWFVSLFTSSVRVCSLLLTLKNDVNTGAWDARRNRLGHCQVTYAIGKLYTLTYLGERSPKSGLTEISAWSH